jgi:SAM-dependent methyltransferase
MTLTQPTNSSVEIVSCPVCGSADQRPARMRIPRDQLASDLGLDGGRSSWVVCSECAMVFQSPRPRQIVVDELYANGGYHRDRGGVPEHYVQYSLRRSVPALNWFHDQIGVTPGRAFDVGCGIGGALVHLRSLGWEVAGIEPDPELSEVARTRFDLAVTTGYFGSGHRLEGVDLVYSCHVWEHLQDPDDAAAGSFEMLRDRKGYLFIVVPTFRKSRTNAWKCFNSSHTLMFTHVSLSNVLRRAGFEIVTHRYVSDADSELWLIARAVDGPRPTTISAEQQSHVQREIMFAPLKAPLGLPGRARKHVRTAFSDPADFVARTRRVLSTRLRSLLK